MTTTLCEPLTAPVEAQITDVVELRRSSPWPGDIESLTAAVAWPTRFAYLEVPP